MKHLTQAEYDALVAAAAGATTPVSTHGPPGVDPASGVTGADGPAPGTGGIAPPPPPMGPAAAPAPPAMGVTTAPSAAGAAAPAEVSRQWVPPVFSGVAAACGHSTRAAAHVPTPATTLMATRSPMVVTVGS